MLLMLAKANYIQRGLIGSLLDSTSPNNLEESIKQRDAYIVAKYDSVLANKAAKAQPTVLKPRYVSFRAPSCLC